MIIKGETTVDATGNANSGPATVEIYNPNGVLVASLYGRYEIRALTDLGIRAFHRAKPIIRGRAEITLATQERRRYRHRLFIWVRVLACANFSFTLDPSDQCC